MILHHGQTYRQNKGKISNMNKENCQGAVERIKVFVKTVLTGIRDWLRE